MTDTDTTVPCIVEQAREALTFVTNARTLLHGVVLELEDSARKLNELLDRRDYR